MSSMEWSADPREVWVNGFDAYVKDIKASLNKFADFYAPQIEAWMKENAIWTDRTGHARQTLHTEVDAVANEVVIYLLHGMDYGVFLELANQGVYSILMPALDYWAPKIWASVEALFA